MLDEQQRWRELQQTISPLLSRMEWRLELPNLLRDQAFWERQNWWNSPVFAAIEEAITRRALFALPDSMLFGVVEALPEIEEAAKGNDVDRLSVLIQCLCDWLIEKLRKLAPGKLSYECSLSIGVSVVTFIISSVLSVALTRRSLDEGTKTEERLTLLIKQQAERLAETADRLKPANDTKIYFVVERTATLKTGPSSKTVVVGKLYPNQKVSLVTAKSKWIEVEYFDYVAASLRRGWVMKKYLQRIR
jgi:hypothetical protein